MEQKEKNEAFFFLGLFYLFVFVKRREITSKKKDSAYELVDGWMDVR